MEQVHIADTYSNAMQTHFERTFYQLLSQAERMDSFSFNALIKSGITTGVRREVELLPPFLNHLSLVL